MPSEPIKWTEKVTPQADTCMQTDHTLQALHNILPIPHSYRGTLGTQIFKPTSSLHSSFVLPAVGHLNTLTPALAGHMISSF